jgi:hypothetical protein
MQSGDCHGLQNRRAAGHPVTGGFDPHSLPPLFSRLAASPAITGIGTDTTHLCCVRTKDKTSAATHLPGSQTRLSSPRAEIPESSEVLAC